MSSRYGYKVLANYSLPLLRLAPLRIVPLILMPCHVMHARDGRPVVRVLDGSSVDQTIQYHIPRMQNFGFS